MDKKYIRIVSNDATAMNIQILAGDQQLKGITKIEFDPVEPGALITARITAMVELDLIAELTGVQADKHAYVQTEVAADGAICGSTLVDMDDPDMAARIANATVTKLKLD